LNALPEKTDLFGQAFEHFIAMELRAYLGNVPEVFLNIA
jgi:hypothetical protein